MSMNYKLFLLFLLIPLSAGAFDQGDRVKCKYAGIGSYYKGRVNRIESGKAYITYDDGETQRVPLASCKKLTQENNEKRKYKQNIPASSSGTLLRLENNNSNGYDSWTIVTTSVRGKLTARNRGKVWYVSLGRTRVKIDTCIGGREPWMKWKYYYKGNQLIAEARSKRSWNIDSSYSRLKVKREMNGTWSVTGKKGTMKVYDKGRRWKSWIVEDRMPGENIHMKLAALFTIIYSSEVLK